MFLELKTPEQIEAKALETYISRLSQRIEDKDFNYKDTDLLPSPPSPLPEYDRQGHRTNTKEQIIKRDLEVERTLAVHQAFELIPDYTPPQFTQVKRKQDKVYIPTKLHPQINFVGLLLGPRGATLRSMEEESGARISIRGRGSSKSMAAQTDPEDLHCLISATSFKCNAKAIELVQKVIQNAIQMPDNENSFKRTQLRELARINGTLKSAEDLMCNICSKMGHIAAECKQNQSGRGFVRADHRNADPSRSRPSNDKQGFRNRESNSYKDFNYPSGPSSAKRGAEFQDPRSAHMQRRAATNRAVKAQNEANAKPAEHSNVVKKEGTPGLEASVPGVAPPGLECPPGLDGLDGPPGLAGPPGLDGPGPDSAPPGLDNSTDTVSSMPPGLENDHEPQDTTDSGPPGLD